MGFIVEGCARVPAQSFYVGSTPACRDTIMDNPHTLPALQAEKNVVCNFELSRCHYLSLDYKVDRVDPASHFVV